MTIAANTTNFRQMLGAMGEQIVVDFLLDSGWTVIERNFCAHRRGEIDIVASPPEEKLLAFIEVKTRDIKPWQNGLEHPGLMAIHPAKQRRMLRAAMHYLSQNPSRSHILRFDAVLVDISMGRNYLNHLILLNDLPTMKKHARITHLQSVAGSF